LCGQRGFAFIHRVIAGLVPAIQSLKPLSGNTALDPRNKSGGDVLGLDQLPVALGDAGQWAFVQPVVGDRVAQSILGKCCEAIDDLGQELWW